MKVSALLAVTFVFAAGAAHAGSDVFAFGDPKQGKKLYEAKCAACHVGQFGGDGSSVFTRADRRIHTAPALLAQIQGCNARTRAGLSAEDEQSIGAWLNREYYKLK